MYVKNMLNWLENFQIYKTKKRSYDLRLFLIYVGSWLSCKTHTLCKLQDIFMMEMKLKKEKDKCQSTLSAGVSDLKPDLSI
ncbi:hypothetical protein L1987_12913 [Smallanthus sonchifolius]|uniref:Uncharacterized protein n=1 Tax=Smallanthus sonchifolius TaxID=185202 RepID=A0ACB9JFM2_9ASTR|nr:hypothetical protein L1987_12913 [Smallanthus sonchifolius]